MIENRYNSYGQYIEPSVPESRWAKEKEIKSASTAIDLSAKKCETAGLPLISDGKKVWVDGRDNHTLIFGSTGSKKTRLFVMPTIGTMIKAGESFVVTDPKGEILEKTADLAASNGYDIKVLNFRDIGNGECWNPLDYPYKLYHEGKVDKASEMVDDIINVLTAKYTGTRADPFWQYTANAFGIGIALLLLEAGEKNQVNMLSVAKMCDENLRSTFEKLFRHMDPSCACAVNLGAVLSAADKTFQSILVSFFADVSIFVKQRNLSDMLSKSTFDVKDFGTKKTAFYLIVPDEKTTLHFLVTTFIKQAYEILIESAQKMGGKLPIRVNFVLDEFCNIPRIPDMPNMISAARSRNIRYFLVVQSQHQLESRYDKDAETIKGNCLNWVFLSSKEYSLLEEISNLCGKFQSDGPVLISTSQLQRLNKEKGEALIIHDRCYPFITQLPDVDDYDLYKVKKNGVIDELFMKYASQCAKAEFLDLYKLELDCRMLKRKYPFDLTDLTQMKEYRNFNKNDIALMDTLQKMILERDIQDEDDFLDTLAEYAAKYGINVDIKAV